MLLNRYCRSALQLLAVGLLIAWMASPAAADKKQWPAPKDPTDYHVIVFDSDDPPPWFPVDANPFNKMASMNSWTVPILDHTGKPHAHGHIIQLIMDGGNGLQDPPNSDGSPGGDDSLAYGNWNMMRLLGLDGPPNPQGNSGMFYSLRYFVPFYQNRAYYLRLWEGDDVAIAPYYQDTVEYDYGTDRGGTMIRIPEGGPMDLDLKFGPSKPRPKPAESSKSH